MQEHPVPQNVTGYEFHLIGSMTLKQFVEVAGGVLIAVIINTTNLPSFVKVPLMIIAGLAGAGLAFVPLEGRPLDRWFFAFIKSIYQPTMFFWKKTNTTPPVFTYTQPSGVDSSPKVDYTPIRQARVREFIHTVAPATPTQSDDQDVIAANAVLKLFSSTPLPVQTAQVPATTPSQNSIGHIVEMNIEPPEPTTPAPAPAPTAPSTLPTPGGFVPQGQTIGYDQKAGITPEHTATASAPTATPVYDASMTPTATQTLAPMRETITKPAPALTGFPFPNKPTTPNVIAGMVVNIEGKLIDGAIVTVLRQADRTPVRAMKTNTLGQFAVVTALDPDSYLITIEKDGYSFDNYSLVVDNTVIAPILLKAR